MTKEQLLDEILAKRPKTTRQMFADMVGAYCVAMVAIAFFALLLWAAWAIVAGLFPAAPQLRYQHFFALALATRTLAVLVRLPVFPLVKK